MYLHNAIIAYYIPHEITESNTHTRYIKAINKNDQYILNASCKTI